VQLPNGLQAYIPSEKLRAYLLSETHAVGKAKATFFRALGFNETNVPLLEQGLLSLAHSAPVQDVVPSPHGDKYIIEGCWKHHVARRRASARCGFSKQARPTRAL
jgi:hypothetical protein